MRTRVLIWSKTLGRYSLFPSVDSVDNGLVLHVDFVYTHLDNGTRKNSRGPTWPESHTNYASSGYLVLWGFCRRIFANSDQKEIFGFFNCNELRCGLFHESDRVSKCHGLYPTKVC